MRSPRQPARVVDLDGWTALPALVPPNERADWCDRSSFEKKDEFESWPTDSPKPTRNGDRQLSDLVSGEEPASTDTLEPLSRALPPPEPAGKCLRLESALHRRSPAPLASPLLIVNPPWTLAGR